MTQALLLMAWPYEDQVLTSLRFASGYVSPDVYTGDATLTTLASSVNDTAFEIVYLCKGCWAWDQNGSTGKVSTSSGMVVMGRAAANSAVGNPGCPDDLGTIPYHARAFGQYGATFKNAAVAGYADYAALPVKAVTPATTCAGATPTGAGNSTVVSTAAPVSCQAVPANKTYDYVIVGGGAGGLPMADRLSEAGHSVLLLEKGPVSTGQWNGTLGPDWLEGSKLTRFDVPGLCNQIWVNSSRYPRLDHVLHTLI